MFKRFALLFLLLNLTAYISKAQLIYLKNKPPTVDVKIALPKSTYKTTDTIIFSVTITNNGLLTQKVLFGKPGGHNTWGMIAHITTASGKPVKLDEPDKHMMDSYLHTEAEEEEKGHFQYLRPGEQLSHQVYLTSLVIFTFKSSDMLPGDYYMTLDYFGNQSNKVHFIVTK